MMPRCRFETYPEVDRHGSHDGVDEVDSCKDTCAIGDGHERHERSANDTAVDMLAISSIRFGEKCNIPRDDAEGNPHEAI